MKRVILLVAAAVVVTVAIFVHCSNPASSTTNCTPSDTTKAIEVVYPKGGEVLKVGQKVVLQWKVNGLKVSESIPEISIDDGLTWSQVSSSGFPSETGVEYQCRSFTWTIGDSLFTNGIWEPLASTNPSCLFRVSDYQGNVPADVSSAFTINQ